MQQPLLRWFVFSLVSVFQPFSAEKCCVSPCCLWYKTVYLLLLCRTSGNCLARFIFYSFLRTFHLYPYSCESPASANYMQYPRNLLLSYIKWINHLPLGLNIWSLKVCICSSAVLVCRTCELFGDSKECKYNLGKIYFDGTKLQGCVEFTVWLNFL